MRNLLGLLLVALALGACGRSTMPGVPGYDAAAPDPDQTVRLDGGVNPERWLPPDIGPPPPPPPPPLDIGPPPTDGPPPPPPLDIGPPPNDGPPPPPPLDIGPPPTDGPPLLADLVLAGLSAQVSGSQVTYTIKTCNTGAGPAGNFYVDVYYDRNSAPKLKNFGNQYKNYSGLAAGACITTTFVRSKTPAGSYASWAQVDADGIVAEASESNNVKGPLAVTVGGTTPTVDLSFKAFSAKLVPTPFGAAIQYTAVVCNKGTAAASLVRVDFYYSRKKAPKPGIYGNAQQTVPSLAAGACTTVSRSYPGPKPKTYSSYVQVDPAGAIKETNESNNVAGPRTVTVGTTTNCSAICTFAISCGLFTSAQYAQCIGWCNGLPSSSKACVTKATKQSSCSALKKCKTPPPPPPPPPPQVCPDLCSFLINTCKYLPANQYWTCVGACQNLGPKKIKCAQDAKKKKQCLQTVLCMF